MVKQLTKLFLVSILALGFLSVTPVAKAHKADQPAHEATGNIEDTLGSICTKDWCTTDTRDADNPIDLFCDPQPMPDVCTDLITYCQNNKDDRNYSTSDAHGKPVIDAAGNKNCANILAGHKLGGGKQDAEGVISDLEAAITIAKAGQVDSSVISRAENKLAAAKAGLKTAIDKGSSDPEGQRIFYERALQLANEGLDILDADPTAAAAIGGAGGGRTSSSPPVTRKISGPGLVTPASGIQGISGLTTAEELAVGIINFFLSFVGIIAVAMLIYGGFLYITAAGDPAKSGKGRGVIIGAVIGILIIIGSWTIVNTVINLQGGSGGSGGGRTAIVKSVQVTISGTTLLGANVRGTVTVFQGDTVNAQLSSDTAGGFIRNTAEVEVTLDKATLLIGGQGGATLPARDAQQVEIPSVGPLRKGKVDITVLQ